MKKLKKWFILSVVALVLVAGVFLAGGLVMRGGLSFGRKTTISGDLLKQEIAEISELAVLRCHYANVGKFEDQLMLRQWKVPLTTKSIIFTYNGEIKLGIDFNHIDVDIDHAGKEITITLPPVRILSHAIDENSIEPYDQSKNIFNQFLIEDYKALIVDQKKAAEKKIITDALMKEAAEIAKKQIGSFVGNFAGVKDEYTVVFA